MFTYVNYERFSLNFATMYYKFMTSKDFDTDLATVIH